MFDSLRFGENSQDHSMFIYSMAQTQAIHDFNCTYVKELDDPIAFQVRTRERHTRSSVSPLK